jgi:aldose 1-epimerase
MQLDTGNFLEDGMSGKQGQKYGHRTGLCLETQHFPDSPNRPSFPSTLLKKGEVFRSQTKYAFSVR